MNLLGGGGLKAWKNKAERFAAIICHQHSLPIFLKFARPKLKRKTPQIRSAEPLTQTMGTPKSGIGMGRDIPSGFCNTLIFLSLVFYFSLVFSNQGISLLFCVFSAIFLWFSRGFLGFEGVNNRVWGGFPCLNSKARKIRVVFHRNPDCPRHSVKLFLWTPFFDLGLRPCLPARTGFSGLRPEIRKK